MFGLVQRYRLLYTKAILNSLITFNVSRAYGALHIVSERRKRLIIRCKFNKNTVKSSVEARELKMGDRIKASDATNNISEFYKGKKVFITGATGKLE